MTYLEAVALLHEIEEKYNVMSICYKGVSIWPFLRLRLLDSISVNSEIRLTKKVLLLAIKSLFYSNPLQIMRKFDYWIIANAERRKMVGLKNIHRISGGISTFSFKSLMIEKPNIEYGHSKIKYIEENNIITESWLLLCTHILMRIPIIRKKQITNISLMNDILKDYGISFDYMHYLKKLVAQKKSMKLLLFLSKKPSKVFFECPYDSMGYLWAFHLNNIPVIELQHGVINKNHDAYNAKYYDFFLNPDAICVFGIEEYNYFKVHRKNYAKDIYMTGLYMLERADNYFKDDIFGDERKKYKTIVLVSGQAGFENQLANFIDKVAPINDDILFIYIPRHNDVQLNFTSPNVKLTKGVNIYQYLKWSDLHVTISSTTCLEAHYFHKPTIFFDYQKMASTYYETVLKPNNAVDYLSDVKDFNKAFNRLLNGKFEYKEIFHHNHIKSILNIIKQYNENRNNNPG